MDDTRYGESTSFEETATRELERITNRLDNLGQLRHLFKLLGMVNSIRSSVESVGQYYQDLNEERKDRQWAAELRYERVAAKMGYRPVSLVPVKYLSLREVDDLFGLS